MTSLLPNLMLICVCANTGVAAITREHCAAALALDVPMLCVVTKADAASPTALARTLREVRGMLASACKARAPRDGANDDGAVPSGSSPEADGRADAEERRAQVRLRLWRACLEQQLVLDA